MSLGQDPFDSCVRSESAVMYWRGGRGGAATLWRKTLFILRKYWSCQGLWLREQNHDFWQRGAIPAGDCLWGLLVRAYEPSPFPSSYITDPSWHIGISRDLVMRVNIKVASTDHRPRACPTMSGLMSIFADGKRRLWWSAYLVQESQQWKSHSFPGSRERSQAPSTNPEFPLFGYDWNPLWPWTSFQGLPSVPQAWELGLKAGGEDE